METMLLFHSFAVMQGFIGEFREHQILDGLAAHGSALHATCILGQQTNLFCCVDAKLMFGAPQYFMSSVLRFSHLSPVSTASATFPRFSSILPPLSLPCLPSASMAGKLLMPTVCCSPYPNTRSAKDASLGGSPSFAVALNTSGVTSPHAHSQDFLFIHFLYLGEQLDSSSCFPPQTVSEMR